MQAQAFWGKLFSTQHAGDPGCLELLRHHLKQGPRNTSAGEGRTWSCLWWRGCHTSPPTPSPPARADHTAPPEHKGAGNTGNVLPDSWSLPVPPPGSRRFPIFCWTKNIFNMWRRRKGGRKVHVFLSVSQHSNLDSLPDCQSHREGGSAFSRGLQDYANPPQKRGGLCLSSWKMSLLIMETKDLGSWLKNK